jgi:hypothetical protein
VAPQFLAGIVATTLGVGLSIPPFRTIIEQNMAWHMVGQMPLLIAGGGLLCSQIHVARRANFLATFNRFGLTGFLLCTVVFSYWMLPLALDKAIIQPLADLTKVVSLLLAGAVLYCSFQIAPRVVQLFFIAYWCSMLIWLGSYFTFTDLRLCNVYSLETQVVAGKGLVLIGAGIGTLWIANLFYKKAR